VKVGTSLKVESLHVVATILWLDSMLVKITLMSFHHFFRFKVGCIWGDLGCKNPNRLELGKNDIFLGKKSFLDHEQVEQESTDPMKACSHSPLLFGTTPPPRMPVTTRMMNHF